MTTRWHLPAPCTGRHDAVVVVACSRISNKQRRVISDLRAADSFAALARLCRSRSTFAESELCVAFESAAAFAASAREPLGQHGSGHHSVGRPRKSSHVAVAAHASHELCMQLGTELLPLLKFCGTRQLCQVLRAMCKAHHAPQPALLQAVVARLHTALGPASSQQFNGKGKQQLQPGIVLQEQHPEQQPAQQEQLGQQGQQQTQQRHEPRGQHRGQQQQGRQQQGTHSLLSARDLCDMAEGVSRLCPYNQELWEAMACHALTLGVASISLQEAASLTRSLARSLHYNNTLMDQILYNATTSMQEKAALSGGVSGAAADAAHAAAGSGGRSSGAATTTPSAGTDASEERNRAGHASLTSGSLVAVSSAELHSHDDPEGPVLAGRDADEAEPSLDTGGSSDADRGGSCSGDSNSDRDQVLGLVCDCLYSAAMFGLCSPACQRLLQTVQRYVLSGTAAVPQGSELTNNSDAVFAAAHARRDRPSITATALQPAVATNGRTAAGMLLQQPPAGASATSTPHASGRGALASRPGPATECVGPSRSDGIAVAAGGLGLRHAAPLAWAAGILGCTCRDLYCTLLASAIEVQPDTSHSNRRSNSGSGSSTAARFDGGGTSDDKAGMSSGRSIRGGGRRAKVRAKGRGSGGGGSKPQTNLSSSAPLTGSRSLDGGCSSTQGSDTQGGSTHTEGSSTQGGSMQGSSTQGLVMLMQGLLCATVAAGGRADLHHVRRLLGLPSLASTDAPETMPTTIVLRSLASMPGTDTLHSMGVSAVVADVNIPSGASTSAAMAGDNALHSPDTAVALASANPISTACSKGGSPGNLAPISDAASLQSHIAAALEAALQRCYAAWLCLARASRPSGTQLWVLRVLRLVPGVDGAAAEVTTADGLFCIDIVCRWRGRLVAVEVDGAQHACANNPTRLLGPSLARMAMLRSIGYLCVRVDIGDWHAAGERQEGRGDAAMAGHLERLLEAGLLQQLQQDV